MENDRTEASSPVIETRNLKKYYNQGGMLSQVLGRSNTIKAVDGVSFEIGKNEVFGLVGESGSGKSTLGETLIRLRTPTAGQIFFNGEDISAASDQDLRTLRKDIQIVFQDPFSSLNPRKTINQSLLEPLDNLTDLSADEKDERVANIMSKVGLRPSEDFTPLYPHQMSGGQLQRANIARALILDPELLIADEPMSMLDVSIQSALLDMISELQNEIGFSILYITHDLSLVNTIADRIAVMYRGRIVEQGQADLIIQDPKHPYTRSLIRSLPDLSRERERVILPTDSTDDTTIPSGCRFHPRCPDKMDVCEEKAPALEVAAGRKVACFLHHEVVEEQ